MWPFSQLPCSLVQKNQEESAEGIYVSKILENGPADKAEGLQIQDKIIEVRKKKKTTNKPNTSGQVCYIIRIIKDWMAFTLRCNFLLLLCLNMILVH